MSVRLLVASLILSLALVLSAEELVVNWAVPLKSEFASIKKREYAGLAYREGIIYAALRDGRVIAFDRAGRKLRERRFSGEFIVAPVAVDEGILLCESNIVRLLDPDLNERWQVSGKSPLVAPPFMRPEGIYLQFLENTVYLVDRATGEVRANYTLYGDNPLSYALLASPMVFDDKVAFGFSNGQVILFLHRTTTGGAEELLPYFKYHTGERRASYLEKREFYDLFSLLPGAEGTILFSNGETSGTLRVVDGSVTPFDKRMRNLRLVPFGTDKVLGYGEGGAWVLSRDGIVDRAVRTSDSFVSGYVPAGEHAFFTETGGAIALYDRSLTRQVAAARIPQGISGGAVWGAGALYLLSDMGVLYSFSIVKREKVQKILAKTGKAGNKTAVLTE